MTITTNSDDRDQLFADWGESITLREITPSFDPQSGQVTETQTDTIITAVIGTSPANPNANTAGKSLRREITVQIKAEDMPASGPTAALRLIIKGGEYQALNFSLTADGAVYELEAVRMSSP